MRTNDSTTVAIGLQCCDFLDLNHGILEPVNDSQARTNVTALLTDIGLNNHAHAQLAVASYGHTCTRRELRSRIRKAIIPVFRTAKATLRHAPEVAALKIPGVGASAGHVILAAHTAADIATRHHQALTRRGLAPFIAPSVRRNADLYTTALIEQRQRRNFRAHLSALLVRDVAKLRRELRVLDALVLSHLSFFSRSSALGRPAHVTPPEKTTHSRRSSLGVGSESSSMSLASPQGIPCRRPANPDLRFHPTDS